MRKGWEIAGDPHHFYKLPPDAQVDVFALLIADGQDAEAAKSASAPPDVGSYLLSLAKAQTGKKR